MKRLLLKVVFFVLMIMSNYTLAGDDFYFRYLNEKVTNYSNKIAVCDGEKVTPKLSEGDMDLLTRVIGERPLILAYLSMKSYNQCLQPERGELAETLLAYNHLDLPIYIKKLAKATEKLTFTTDFDSLKSYESLSKKDRGLIDSIIAFQKPFNELEVFEKIMGM